MSTEDIEKRYKRALIRGIPLVGTGVVFFLLGIILVKSEKEEEVSMSKEDKNKRFKRKLIFGIIYFGIGVVLIIIGLVFQNILEKIYFSVFKLHHVLWVISGILILFGVWYLFDSIRTNYGNL